LTGVVVECSGDACEEDAFGDADDVVDVGALVDGLGETVDVVTGAGMDDDVAAGRGAADASPPCRT